MTLFLDCFTALLAAFGLMCLLWMAAGWLLRPAGTCPVRAVVSAAGGGEGLEQTVRSLLWLRACGLWQGAVVIEDSGLDEGGAALARALAERDGVLFAAVPGKRARSA